LEIAPISHNFLEKEQNMESENMESESVEIYPAVIMDENETKFLVQLGPSNKGVCGTSCKCGASALLGSSKGQKIWIEKDENHHKKGDLVWIEAHLPSMYLGILFVFVFPVLAIIIGAYIGDQIAMKYTWNRDFLAIIGGIIALCISLFIAFCCDKYLCKKKEVFKISSDPFPEPGPCPHKKDYL